MIQLLRCPEEGAKVSRLFMLPKNNTVSEWHRDRNILTNANELFNMLQSNFLLALKQQDATEYYEVSCC